MSRLDELIAELCPDGVEYKTLGEIATDIFRGSGIKREDVTTTGIPCVRYGEIYTTYGVWFDTCVSHTILDKVQSPKYFEHGDILFVITGESVEDISKSTAYTGHEKCLAGGDIVVMKHHEDPKYLSYALSSNDARRQKSAGKVKSKVVHSSVPAIKGIRVPIPPLPVQQEIVRILDQFTELLSVMESERVLREKERAAYSSMIFERYKKTKSFRIGEICLIEKGRTPIQKASPGCFPLVVTTTERKTSNQYQFDKPAVCVPLVSSRGHGVASLNHVYYQEGKYALGNILCAIMPRTNDLLAKYLYYYFEETKDYTLVPLMKGGANVALHINDIERVKIPVPPIEEQFRIISELQVFEELCSAALPAEIAARQKQYEYYRDKLLTFKELSKS